MVKTSQKKTSLEIQKILLDYGGLTDGEQRNGELCPFCAGGRTGERTFSVRREGGGLLYNCFRASCGVGGVAGLSGKAVVGTQHQSGHSVPESGGVKLYQNSDNLTENEYGYLAERYRIGREDCDRHGIRYERGTGRFVLPIRNPEGEVVGVVFREPAGIILHHERVATALDKVDSSRIATKPKAKTIGPRNSASFYRASDPSAKAVVLVEDIYSAIRASKYVKAVALLGVGLNEEKFEKCKDFAGSTGTIYLCLDADAFATAVRLALKYKVKVLHPHKDLKDMEEDELQEFLKENIQ